ncbi:MAG: hypothetical protein K8T91_03395 [Planctomycetes bacterium]|nr:hypothetical protein [Planctomycetota bacterium]
MDVVAGLLGCIGFLILPTLFTWLTARWILGPISRAAKIGRGQIQFRIIDFFCLVVEMQAVAAVVVAVSERDEPGFRTSLLLFGTLSTLALWVGGVHTLSRAGILDPRRRTVFNWVVLPSASIGALVLVPLVVWLVGTSIAISTGSRQQPASSWLWVLAVLLGAALVASKWLADWVMAELPPEVLSPPFPPIPPIPRYSEPPYAVLADDEPMLAEIVEPDPPAET